MPESATIEPPVQNTPDLAQQVFNPPPSAPPSAPKTQITNPSAPEKPAVQPKPEIAGQAEAPKKKGPLEKLGAIKKPEVAPEGGALPQVQPGPTKEDNIAILRKSHEELNKLRPEYEKLKNEYGTTTEELKKLKALGLNEQERTEFVRYREMNAVEAVRASQDFQAKIMKPINSLIDKIKAVGENAQLDDAQKSALGDACDIADEWKRNKAIRSIVRGDKLEPEDYQALADAAISASKDLNETWYPKHDELLQNAYEVQMAARNKEQVQQREMSQKEIMEQKKAHDEVFSTLSGEALKPIFEDADLSVEGMTINDALQNLEPASTPHEKAYRELIAAAAPFILEYANRALAKAAQAEAALRKMGSVAPSRNDGNTKPMATGEKQATAEDVFGNHRRI